MKQALQAAKDGEVIYEKAGEPKEVTKKLLQEHKDARFDHATRNLTVPQVSAQSIKGATTLQELRSVIAQQTGVSKVSVKKIGNEFQLEVQINPITVVGKLTFDDMTPEVGEKILLLGEADFGFARSLAAKLKSNRVVATSYEKTAGTYDQKGKTKTYTSAPANIAAAKEDGAQIVAGVDAQNIDPNLGGLPAHFQYIVFNYPTIIVNRTTINEVNRTMIAKFLRSASAALKSGGKIYLSSKEYWLVRWNLPEAATAAGLTCDTDLKSNQLVGRSLTPPSSLTISTAKPTRIPPLVAPRRESPSYLARVDNE